MTTKQVITLKDVRPRLSELIARVTYGKQSVIITRFGKPVASLVNYADYERMMNPRKGFSEKEWQKGFVLIDKARSNASKHSPKKVQAVIDQAVSEVQTESYAQSSS